MRDRDGRVVLVDSIGAIYLVVGFSLLRLFEYEGRRTATLETF